MTEIPREIVETSEIKEVPAEPVQIQPAKLSREHLQRIAELMTAPGSDAPNEKTTVETDIPAEPENEV